MAVECSTKSILLIFAVNHLMIVKHVHRTVKHGELFQRFFARSPPSFAPPTFTASHPRVPPLSPTSEEEPLAPRVPLKSIFLKIDFLSG